MRTDRLKAAGLRREGKSYREIHALLGVAKSTLSNWFKEEPYSGRVKDVLSTAANPRVAARIKKMNEANAKKWKEWRVSAVRAAEKEFIKFKSDPLFVAGVMLYWGEGDNKEKNPLRLINTNPAMIKIYIKFLKKYVGLTINDLRGNIIIYPDLLVRECLRYWQEVTGIPLSQFYKVQVIKGRHPTKRLSYGTCTVISNSRWAKLKVLTWVDLFSKFL